MNGAALHGAAASTLMNVFGDQHHMRLSSYVWARAILGACFVAIVILAIRVYGSKPTKDDLAIWGAVLGLIAAIAGIFSTRPLRDDSREVVPEIVGSMPADVLAKL